MPNIDHPWLTLRNGFDGCGVSWAQVGADLTMGSLIKSPGGTVVPSGGYIAGRADLVAAAGARLTAPGIGLDAGAVPGETLRLMFQGLFRALSHRSQSSRSVLSASRPSLVRPSVSEAPKS